MIYDADKITVIRLLVSDFLKRSEEAQGFDSGEAIDLFERVLEIAGGDPAKPAIRHFEWLVRIYDAWLDHHNLEPLSADELMATDVTPAQRRWLGRYCDLWDKCFIG